MGQHRTLGQPSGAARVLQKGDRIHRAVVRLERKSLSSSHCLVEGRDTQSAVAWQLVGGDHFLDPAHHEIDYAAIHSTQQVAHVGHDYVLDLRATHHLLQGAGKVLQDHDGGGPRVLELVLELARGVQRIDVNAGVTGAQHGGHGDRKLRNIRQHDGYPRTGLEPLGLQPRTQRTR